MKDETILRIENLSKQYRLGTVGTGTLSHDINRAWAKIRGKEDPYLKIGAVNDRSSTASSDYVWALKDINFEVKRGEIVGIIGKNGAGKSTLLKILSRVTSPTTGSIKVGGRMASLLEVGTGMHPELTGRENIYLNGAILGMTKAEISSKIDEIIDFSGCQMYIDTPVKRYSSGMGVRLGFAVAAFLEPDILVVDEVLAVGDAEFQKKAIGKMQDISSTGGRTVLFVSHNMASLRKLCTKGILLKNGEIFYQSDHIGDCINKYLQFDTLKTKIATKYFDSTKKFGILATELLLNDNVIDVEDWIRFKITFRYPEKGEYICAFYLRDDLGEVLFFSENTDSMIILNEKNEIVNLRFRASFLLAGNYTATFGIKSSDGSFLDVVKDRIALKISDTYRYRNSRPGKIALPVFWEV